MKVLFIHNTYKYRGGEDTVVYNEIELLRSKGHSVDLLELKNDSIQGLTQKVITAFASIYSFKSKNVVRDKIRVVKPDVIHVHNFFPQISPSAYDAAIEEGIPVVQTLHNYRVICPGALLLRNGQICEKCVGGNFSNAIIHKCYRNSVLGSSSVAIMDFFHKKRDTWNTRVNKLICLTQFAKSKFIDFGFDKTQLVVKPNFVSKYILEETTQREGHGLFVGRISYEKGIKELIKIHDELIGSIHIVGDGPLKHKLKGLKKYKVLGLLSPEEVIKEMHSASFLVFPSINYEGFPMTIVEAFSAKLPVIATNIGAMAEVIRNDYSGLHVSMGNLDEMAKKINWAFDNTTRMREYGENAFNEYNSKYTDEINYQQLLSIYKDVISKSDDN